MIKTNAKSANVTPDCLFELQLTTKVCITACQNFDKLGIFYCLTEQRIVRVT